MSVNIPDKFPVDAAEQMKAISAGYSPEESELHLVTNNVVAIKLIAEGYTRFQIPHCQKVIEQYSEYLKQIDVKLGLIVKDEEDPWQSLKLLCDTFDYMLAYYALGYRYHKSYNTDEIARMVNSHICNDMLYYSIVYKKRDLARQLLRCENKHLLANHVRDKQSMLHYAVAIADVDLVTMLCEAGASTGVIFDGHDLRYYVKELHVQPTLEKQLLSILRF